VQLTPLQFSGTQVCAQAGKSLELMRGPYRTFEQRTCAMRTSNIEPRIAVITAGAVLILTAVALASYFLLSSLPAAWPPSRDNLLPLAVVASLAAVILGGLQLWVRRHTSLRVTSEGIQVATFWGRRKIPWHAITAARRIARAGVTIESTMGAFSLGVLLFRPTNGLVNSLEKYLGARAVDLPHFEE
jgi:hypothetical protein